jgi:hypothetical protein
VLIKIGDCFVDPLEIAMICDSYDSHLEVQPMICIHLRHGSGMWIHSTMDEAEAALIDAGVMEEPAEDETPDLTDEEKEELTGLFDAGFEWLARDGDGKLFAYNAEPEKTGAFWDVKGDQFQAQRVKAEFDFIAADDAKPWSIPYLLLS